MEPTSRPKLGPKKPAHLPAEPAQPEMDSTPQAGPYQQTPEPGGPEIGSWYIDGTRYVKIVTAPTLDPDLDPLGEPYPTVVVEINGKKEIHAMDHFKKAVEAPKLKNGKWYTWTKPSGEEVKVRVELIRHHDGKEYGLVRDTEGKKFKIPAS